MSCDLRQLKAIYSPGSQHWVGNGFPVRNLFPSNPLYREMSPFLLLDYAGPRYFEPTDQAQGVSEHPHRGFETVTLLYQGALSHRDSAGNSGILQAGDVQWMTAASGVVHEEMHEMVFARQGGQFEAVQLWVNLPRTHKMDPPTYQDIASSKIPTHELPEGGYLRIIAGTYLETQGPAHTHTPINLWDLKIPAGSHPTLPIPRGHNLGVFVLSGLLGWDETHRLGETQLAVFDNQGEVISLPCIQEARLLVLSGQAIAEPIAARGPFVMNTGEEISQAIRDYQSGKMGHLT